MGSVVKLLRAAIVLALVVSFFAYVGLWEYYDHTRPTAAEPAQGRIHPLETHGSIVYLTLEESDYLRNLGWLTCILLVVQGAIMALVRRARPARPPGGGVAGQ
jgi:hypothetical protein